MGKNELVIKMRIEIPLFSTNLPLKGSEAIGLVVLKLMMVGLLRGYDGGEGCS